MPPGTCTDRVPRFDSAGSDFSMYAEQTVLGRGNAGSPHGRAIGRRIRELNMTARRFTSVVGGCVGPRAAGDVEGFEAAGGKVAAATEEVVVAKDEVAAAEAKVAVAKEEVVVAEAADNAQAISWAHQTMNVALRSLDSAQAGLEEATTAWKNANAAVTSTQSAQAGLDEATRAWKNANAAVTSTQVTLDGAQHRLAKLLDGYDAAMEGA